MVVPRALSRRVLGSVVAVAALVGVVALAVGLQRPAPAPVQTADPTREIEPLPVDAVVDYQLGGAYVPADDVTVVVRDHEAPAVPDLYGICYINAFQTQPGTLDWWEQNHPDLLLRNGEGDLVGDPNWPDEVLLDTRPEHREEYLALMSEWFAGCAQAGFKAVEPDNLDSFGRSENLLTLQDAEDIAAAMVDMAHAEGLAIAQKNTLEIDGSTLGFDFTIAEECAAYDTCWLFEERYGDEMIQVEYTDNVPEGFERSCAERGDRISIIQRDRLLLPPWSPDHVARRC